MIRVVGSNVRKTQGAKQAKWAFVYDQYPQNGNYLNKQGKYGTTNYNSSSGRKVRIYPCAKLCNM